MLSVAVLEDQRLLRDALADLLAAGGFAVTCASGDPEEVIASLRARPADLALLDLYLGGEESGAEPRGLEVLRELRRWSPGIKPVVLSATYDESLIGRVASEGAVAYVDKNAASPAEMVPTLKRVAAGERLFPATRLFAAAPRVESPVLATLTSREREVLAQVATGSDNLEIAKRLGISERTVRAHVSALYRKVDAKNRTELALSARRLGVHASRGS